MLTSVIRRCCCHLNAAKIKQFNKISSFTKVNPSYASLKTCQSFSILGKRSIQTSSTFMARQNCYKVLGISPDATQKEIREAYLELTQPLHPINNSKKSDEFERYRKAYNTLKVDSSRKEHDKEVLGRDFYDDVGSKSKVYPQKKDPEMSEKEDILEWAKEFRKNDEFKFDASMKFSLVLIGIFIYLLSQMV